MMQRNCNVFGKNPLCHRLATGCRISGSGCTSGPLIRPRPFRRLSLRAEAEAIQYAQTTVLMLPQRHGHQQHPDFEWRTAV